MFEFAQRKASKNLRGPGVGDLVVERAQALVIVVQRLAMGCGVVERNHAQSRGHGVTGQQALVFHEGKKGAQQIMLVTRVVGIKNSERALVGVGLYQLQQRPASRRWPGAQQLSGGGGPWVVLQRSGHG